MLDAVKGEQTMQPYNQFPQNEQEWQAWVDMERWRAAATRSYVNPAIITLILYFCCYVPGLIANLVYLVAAWDTRQQVRRAPEGLGCLVALLLIFGIGPIAAFFLAYFMAMHL
jgi:hypothetical protein